MSIYQSFHLFTSIGKRAVGLGLKGLLVTARKRNLGQGNVFKPLSQSVCLQGVSALLHAGKHTPWQAHPSCADTPPLVRHALPPGQTPPPQADTTGCDQQADGMHPTLMHTFFLV